MSAIWAVLAIAAALVVTSLLMWRGPRSRAAQKPPDGWREELARRVPQAAYVDDEQRARYEARVEQFLRGKRLIGCADLIVDDSMRVAVAGLAALLVLRPKAGMFPAVREILMYPDAFLVPHSEPDESGLVSDDAQAQIGESWRGDRVILSWSDVEDALHGAAHNVVAHEFAHQLDDETPGTEGAPALRDYTRWSKVMRYEYERLKRHRRPPVLDPYGAESPAEFFAVCSEAFFQRPRAMMQHHTELYALFRGYFGLDPAAHPELWSLQAH